MNKRRAIAVLRKEIVELEKKYNKNTPPEKIPFFHPITIYKGRNWKIKLDNARYHFLFDLYLKIQNKGGY